MGFVPRVPVPNNPEWLCPYVPLFLHTPGHQSCGFQHAFGVGGKLFRFFKSLHVSGVCGTQALGGVVGMGGRLVFNLPQNPPAIFEAEAIRSCIIGWLSTLLKSWAL